MPALLIVNYCSLSLFEFSYIHIHLLSIRILYRRIVALNEHTLDELRFERE